VSFQELSVVKKIKVINFKGYFFIYSFQDVYVM
jgi:hypothetical protein